MTIMSLIPDEIKFIIVNIIAPLPNDIGRLIISKIQSTCRIPFYKNISREIERLDKRLVLASRHPLSPMPTVLFREEYDILKNCYGKINDGSHPVRVWVCINNKLNIEKFYTSSWQAEQAFKRIHAI